MDNTRFLHVDAIAHEKCKNEQGQYEITFSGKKQIVENGGFSFVVKFDTGNPFDAIRHAYFLIKEDEIKDLLIRTYDSQGRESTTSPEEGESL